MLIGSVRDCKLRNATHRWGKGIELLILARPSDEFSDVTVPVRIALKVAGNTFQKNVNGVMVHPIEFETGLSDEETLIGLDSSENTYRGNFFQGYENAHLHLWTTNAFLRSSFEIMDAWGFSYKSCLVWVKDEIGMGNYWRVSHEYLLLGVRGRLTFSDRTLPSWIKAHRTTHSRKPGVVRELIERASPGPYLELFGREELPHSNWTVFGNDIQPRLF